MKDLSNIANQDHVLVIGSNGAIGSALVDVFAATANVVTLSRKLTNYQEPQLEQLADHFASLPRFKYIICCIGTLQDDVVKPEKSLRQVKAGRLQHYFYINSILPILLIKHFSVLLDKKQTSCFACLSAMVGSTQDNRLGGWYGYRASKAALNSLVKTAAIELRRSHQHASLVAIHPGTTRGAFSAPFADNIKPENYFTPQLTAQRIKAVIEGIKPEYSGGFFNWDGSPLPF